MELNTSMGIGGVFDDSEQALMTTASNNHGLVNGPVGSESTRSRHLLAVRSRVALQRWVHGAKIWTRGRRVATTLGRDCGDAAGPSDEDTRILVGSCGVKEDVRTVNVNDLALALLATILTNDIVESDLGTIAVSSHSELPLGELIGDLRRLDLLGIAVLV